MNTLNVAYLFLATGTFIACIGYLIAFLGTGGH